MIESVNKLENNLNQHLLVVFREILPLFTKNDIKYWVFGGIGVAGLTGKFIRENHDVDVYVLNDDFAKIENLLKTLCEIHGNWLGDAWSLSYSVLKNTKRWKLDLYIKNEKKFSVTPVYKTISGVEIRFAEPCYLSDQALVQELKVINGLEFFSPPKDIITQLFRVLVERYRDQYNKKSTDDISKILIDAQALYSEEEFAELFVEFKKKDFHQLPKKERPLPEKPKNINQKIKEFVCNPVISSLNIIELKTKPKLNCVPIISQTQEQYLKTHKLTYRDIVRLAELRLMGVKECKQFLGFINYLEANGHNYVNKFIVLRQFAEIDRVNNLVRKSLKVRVTEFLSTPGLVIAGRSKVPFNFDMKLVGPAVELYKAGPAKILELLQLIGYWSKDSANRILPAVSSQTIKDLLSEDLFEVFKNYLDVPEIQEFVITNSKKISLLSLDKLKIYLDIFCLINDSSVYDIKFLKIPLLTQLLESKQPLEDYKQIETIFVGNISLSEKIYGAFKVLYGANDDIYQDLIRIDKSVRENILSDNLKIETDNLIKAVNLKNIQSILRNGCLAKELLGESSDFNDIPFHISLSKTQSSHGEVLLVLRNNKDQHLKTIGDYYELRTGFSSTDIKFLIVRDRIILTKARELEQLFVEIAQNGFYLPVISESGELIFSLEMYNEYSKAFAGLEKFSQQELIFKPTISTDKYYSRITSLISEISDNNKYVTQLSEVVSNSFKEVLSSLKVDSSSLLDIGSTKRQTNVRENFDLDFSLKLEAKDFSRVTEIALAIENILSFDSEIFYQEDEVYYQLRVKGVKAIGNYPIEKPFDLDICLFSRAVLDEYSTHDTISDKLNYIKNNYGLVAYEQTLANMILTKELLKNKNAYKRGKHGGFGGGGVEAWIIANGGNMEEAFKTFKSAAYFNGQLLSYEKFLEKYQIWDAGINNKSHQHDNFIEVMKPNGYEALLDIIEDYFKD